jgi:superfamily II DNA or RNA helicase
MITAKLVRREAVIVGVLNNVPEFLCLEGGETVTKYSRHFTDLVCFSSIVNYLKDQIDSSPPYLEFAISKPVVGQKFDWSLVPESTMETIMDHQRDAIETVVTVHHGRSLVALQPGLGKTLIGSLLALHYGPRVLFVTPAAKIRDWQREYAQWTAKSCPKILTKLTGNDVPMQLVGSFDMVKTCKAVLESNWDVIVVDECHKLKGDSIRTNAMMPMLKRTGALVMLSGTPQENKPSELFNQLHALHPNVFVDRDVFTERYSDSFLNKWNVREERGAKNLDELSHLIARCAYRRGDINVVSHELSRNEYRMEPTSAQQDELILLEEERLVLCKAVQRAQTERTTLLARNKLNVHINLMWKTAGMFKAANLEAQIREWVTVTHADEKIAFFVFHKDVGRIVADTLEKYGECITVNGTTPLPARDTAISAFRQVTGGPRFGVMSMDAVGEGVNFAPGVSVIVCVELHRVPSRMEQVEKRAHRKGAARPVTSYWCLLNGSSDLTTLEKIQTKQRHNTTVLDGKRTKFEFV